MSRFKQSHIKAWIELKEHGNPDVRVIPLDVDDIRSPLMHEADKSHRARLAFRLGEWGGTSEYGGDGATYSIEIGGEIPCSEETFWSGEAHGQLRDHLLGIGLPEVGELNKKWLGGDRE